MTNVSLRTASPSQSALRQPGDLGFLSGVIRGFSEETRNRGFASRAFARFAFVFYGDFYPPLEFWGQLGKIPSNQRPLLAFSGP